MSTTLILPPLYALDAAAADLGKQAEQRGDRALVNAANKALFHLHAGVQPVPVAGGFLVASATRAGTVHRVDHVEGCSCEAGRAGRACWHQTLITIIEQAHARALPPKPRVKVTPAMIEAGRQARRERAYAEMDELFA